MTSRQLTLQKKLIRKGLCRQSCGRKAKKGSTYCWQCLKKETLRKRRNNSSGRGRPRHYGSKRDPRQAIVETAMPIADESMEISGDEWKNIM